MFEHLSGDFMLKRFLQTTRVKRPWDFEHDSVGHPSRRSPEERPPHDLKFCYLG